MNVLMNDKRILSKRVMDFDIHGIVGIRVINPTIKHAAAITKRLGTPQGSLSREPDIVIRFEENLTPPTLIYMGLNSTAFTDEAFYLLSRINGEVAACIPFNKIGDQCEIICQRRIGSVPLLFDIIRLTLLKKNYIPLHASAFIYDGIGILVMGWAKGGKTEMLLSFANHGAHYVGDEWVVLSSDGQEMFGLPVPVALRDWHFKYIPTLLPKISVYKKMLFKSVHFVDAFYKVIWRRVPKEFFPRAVLERVLPLAREQLYIKELPQAIFKDQFYNSIATLNKLFLIMSHSDPDIRVETCESVELARRMVSANEYEQLHFFEYYKAFKFAFPDQKNEFLESFEQVQKCLLSSALGNKEAYKVLHPYPVSFELLFDRLRPFCEKGS
jgi:hypothetical protein